ncbi:MAG: AMP-binding protein [Bryobacteraceae bacterium]|nr:AMP-binding protein [Bryobacteraceae bacterium]
MSEFAWSPDTATIERAQLTGFLKATGHRSFDEMYRWSVNYIGAFTKSVLEFLDIPFQRPYHDVLDLSQGPEWAKWCVGGDLNISIACLDVHPPDRLAVIWEGEEGITRALTYAELRWQTDAFAARMASLGIARSDAVGIHLPMVPETVIALLACARLGAVAVPLFSGYGPVAIAARLTDVGAKLIVTADEFPRRGASVDSRSAVEEALSRCPCVQHVITIPRNGLPVESAADAIIPVTTGAEDLLLALYTSGTTGRPKGILHSHCGFPIKAAQDMCFGTDVGPGTRICWITDIGWMMGPWLIYGALIRGATMCLYDGAPDYPGPGRMWEFCERHSVEVLGISPTLVRSLAAHGSEHARKHDLSNLRLFASTGEPWNPDPWWWLFRDVGQERIPIINYSGGTEISGGILMSNPLLPIKPCAFAAPCPGIDADVLDENGQSVLGTVGELVIRKPWIGMARGFNNDADRYLSTYWKRWPGIWTHGDWAKRGQDGQWYILGRSDDTLKVAGKRIGPAEVESILVSHDAVLEAAVIGIPHEVKGECMIAFCVLLPDRTASPQLASELREIVGIQLGKPLRPDSVYFVTAIPKTRNAKVMRRVIRAAWLDLDSGDLTALDNPQSLDVIRSARE